MPRMVIAIPNSDFDPTEVVVPWRRFLDAGFQTVFATPDGMPGQCDPLLITGVIFGQLGALPENLKLYRKLEEDRSFQNPIPYSEIPIDADVLLLPGGHAKGIIPYLESAELQAKVLAYFKADRPVGAICHGTIVLARSRDPETGRSVIHGRRVTGLPKSLECTAWLLTAWKLGNYYRTYPKWVQQEVAEAAGDPALFDPGPFLANYGNPFTVQDGQLITARWPGDATGFADALLALVTARPQT